MNLMKFHEISTIAILHIEIADKTIKHRDWTSNHDKT